MYTLELIKHVHNIINLNNFFSSSEEEVSRLKSRLKEEFNLNLSAHDIVNILNCNPYIDVEEALADTRSGRGIYNTTKYTLQLILGDKMPDLYQCHSCRNWFDSEIGSHTDSSGNIYCANCFDNYVVPCYECGELLYVHDTIKDVSGDNYCRDCANEHLYYCDICDNYSTSNDTVWDSNGDYMCTYCYGHYYCTCSNCGEFVRYEDAFPSGDNNYCECCYEENHYNIHDYSYKPTPIFHGSGQRFLGVELEVDDGENNSYTAREVVNILGQDHVYCKNDGSLTYGFEIVSHPATLNYHTTSIDWKLALDYLKEEGYTSHDAGTCGIHVHMNRREFGETEEEQELGIAKILYFFERFWEKIVKFSRRTYEQLDEWAAKYLDGVPDHPEDILDYAKNDMSRYRCVNLCPHSTVEIRVFRGSLNYETFMATLQFCELLYDVAEMPLEDVMNITWSKFKEMGSIYPEFTSYLERRGL